MSEALYPADKLRPCPLASGLFTGSLPGGMRVVIRQDRRSPVAVCNIWVAVGSNREPEALRGWSHGIEHMLFKGTSRRGESDFALEVASAGGSTNAGTGYETTNYHITLPAAKLGTAVDILGDALLHSAFAPAALDAERPVLVHENHMYDDIPFGFGITWRWGLELAFDCSPYRNPIGGRDENLLNRSRDEIVAFWRSAYHPGNMLAVVVGDIDPQFAYEQLARAFAGKAPTGEQVPDSAVSMVSAPPIEPTHHQPRLRVEYGDLQKAYAKLIFPAPGEGSGCDPVLSVVHRVLSDGRSCRLYRRLKEELKLVDDFAVMTETGPREGVVLVDIETSAERLAAALGECARILGDLGRDGCTDNELARAARRSARGHLFGLETVQGQAATIGHHAINDDLAAAFEFHGRVGAVTRDDVVAYCRRVFSPGNLACVLYLPRSTDAAACKLPANIDDLEVLVGPHLKYEGAVPDVPRPGAPGQKTAPGRTSKHPPAKPGALQIVSRPRRLLRGR